MNDYVNIFMYFYRNIELYEWKWRILNIHNGFPMNNWKINRKKKRSKK